MNEVEVKGVVDALIKKFKVLLDPDRVRSVVDVLIRKNYNKGVMMVEEQVQVDFNIVPNKNAIEFISNYTFDLVKDMTDELTNKLRAELTRGIMNGESSQALKERVKKVMNVGEARAKAIARTESHRAYNMGNYDAATQSGLKLKKRVWNPSPKSAICKALVKRNPISLKSKFSYDGEEWLVPPFHVNCRSSLLYEQEEDL